MRIGIDARLFKGKGNMTGIAITQYEIVKSLAQYDRQNDYYLFSRENIVVDFPIPSNWKLIVKPFRQGMIWYNTILIRLLKEYKIDVFWNCNHILPLTKPKHTKYVLTIHDLALCKFKGIGETSNVIKQRLFVRYSCKLADKIATVSECTKNDLIEIMKISEDKIEVCYNGGIQVSEKASIESIHHTKRKFGIDGPYIFYLGTLEPRKNIITAIHAFELVRKQMALKFVIAGGKGWKYQPVLDAISSSSYKKDIILTGYVSLQEKAALYTDASVFVFPSLYEGFGIPILEAFNYGVPVVTAYNSSLPEVGGEAAIYIKNAQDCSELAQQITKAMILDKRELEDIVQAEKKQMSKFSWKKSASIMKHIFEECGEQELK